MMTDTISEVGINSTGQLYIKPNRERFNLIWRSATEVHWNGEEAYLYSPKPREWSYLDWYKHILCVIENEYRCKLIINIETSWFEVSDDLQDEIMEFNSRFMTPL